MIASEQKHTLQSVLRNAISTLRSSAESVAEPPLTISASGRPIRLSLTRHSSPPAAAARLYSREERGGAESKKFDWTRRRGSLFSLEDAHLLTKGEDLEAEVVAGTEDSAKTGQ